MNDRDLLAEQFEHERPQLRRIAYRMLGTLDEADDAVQEAWLRLSRTDGSAVDNLGAWLTTVVRQAPRLSTAESSLRLSRIHASCTASSASSRVPSRR